MKLLVKTFWQDDEGRRNHRKEVSHKIGNKNGNCAESVEVNLSSALGAAN